ncbi:hypothetical protein [Bradyrhizobium barranii]
MSLTSANLVGYLRAEFAKASRLRVWLFFVQLAVAVPGAVSVVIPDNYHVTLYILAIFGAALLLVWWLLSSLYVSAQSAAQAARRGALLLGGLAQPLSPSEILSLRERFTVSAEEAARCENPDYYATKLPPGPGRLAEMIEESALYSGDLQRISARVMLFVMLIFVAGFFVIALLTTPFLERDTNFIVIRLFLATLVFAMSSDMVGAYQKHRTAAREIKDIRTRLSMADRNGYPLPDVLPWPITTRPLNRLPKASPGCTSFTAPRWMSDGSNTKKIGLKRVDREVPREARRFIQRFFERRSQSQ